MSYSPNYFPFSNFPYSQYYQQCVPIPAIFLRNCKNEMLTEPHLLWWNQSLPTTGYDYHEPQKQQKVDLKRSEVRNVKPKEPSIELSSDQEQFTVNVKRTKRIEPNK
jgi:hypothetical protein